MHPAYRLSGLARPVDPSYRTNRAIGALSLLALPLGAAWALREGASPGGAAVAAVGAALAAFLSWAYTRELSPDDDAAAFLAVALGIAAWLWAGGQTYLVGVSALLGVRLVNRSTGAAAHPADTGGVVTLFSLMGWFVSWSCGVVGGLALALDGLLPTAGGQPARKRHLELALLPFGVGVLRALGEPAALRLPPHPLVPCAVALAALAAAAAYPRPRSRGDVDGVPLVPARVRAGLALGVAAAALAALDGAMDARGLAWMWGCLAAAALGSVRLRL